MAKFDSESLRPAVEEIVAAHRALARVVVANHLAISCTPQSVRTAMTELVRDQGYRYELCEQQVISLSTAVRDLARTLKYTIRSRGK